MAKKIKFLVIMGLTLFMVGCSTTGQFVVPEGSDLYINNRAEPVEITPDGTVTTRPYAWNAIGIPPGGGIPYRLVEEDGTTREGRLRSKFRPESLFWPPYAILYWPVGLNPDITYDLVNDTQE